MMGILRHQRAPQCVMNICILAAIPAYLPKKGPTRKPAPAPAPAPVRVQGIATFNNYGDDQSTVCSNANVPTTADNVGIFAAAAGDISKDISTGLCTGSQPNMDFHYNTSICTANGGQYPSPNYIPPSCPPGAVRCGTCYRVDNIGAYGSTPSSQIYGTVIVQIIDACPAGNAQNYCKTKVPPDERCGSNQTNSLDIDVGAYRNLTAGMMGGGVEWDSHQPNLRINITLDVPCHT
ncbi:hypothetical protein BDR22DRAFT_627525 [Usnea florida]